MGGIELMGAVVWSSFVQTLYMVFWSTLLSVILGFIPALVLTLTAPDGLRPNKVVYETLSLIVNIFRSFPFIILLIIIIPFTRLIIGKAIGTRAAVVPLTVSAIPYIARIGETSLRETDPGVIEAARSFGASDLHQGIHPTHAQRRDLVDHLTGRLFGHGRNGRRRRYR